MPIGDLAVRARYAAKSVLRPLLFRHPPIGLQPERLYLWLRTLVETRAVEGDVVEIGCSSGGTASVADSLVRRLDGPAKRYVCVDTFGGFDAEQFAADAALHTPTSSQASFSASSQKLVRKILDGLGNPDVALVQGDIVTLDPDALPERISACLVDVDLSEPVHAALQKVHARLVPGGVILVDDCPEGSTWRARLGYQRFVAEAGLPERYEHGMGLIGRAPVG